MNDEHSEKHFGELLTHFDKAMLVTQDDKTGMRSRPMMIAGRDGTAVFWFSTSKDSDKAEEIRASSACNVSMQSTAAFVSITGQAELVDDRAKIAELWKEAWKVWFPQGKDDPSITLVRVTAQSAEYWDTKGTKGIRYLFEAAKAYVKGTRVDGVEGTHGTVKP